MLIDSFEVSKSHTPKESTRWEDNSHFFSYFKKDQLTVSNRIQSQEKVAIRTDDTAVISSCLEVLSQQGTGGVMTPHLSR